jgi:GDP-4-dehydro-6-deoxy-D-mannose reductase
VRSFITGGYGFVGGWMVSLLESQGDDIHLLSRGIDIRDLDSLASELTAYDPEVIYHFAGFTHVGLSWEHPRDAIEVNAIGALNVLEAARRCNNSPRILLPSSAEVYGAVNEEDLPLSETSAVRPMTPYAVSKVTVEYLGLQAYMAYGMDVILVRPFNHAGPGQPPSFFVPALAGRILDALRVGASSVAVGNLSSRRDLTDVRDVVRAYRMLVDSGEPGEIYNVCTGEDVSMAQVAELMAEIAQAEIEFVPDPLLMRPVDIPVLRGDSQKLKMATGWAPQYNLRDTLADVLNERRSATRVAGTSTPDTLADVSNERRSVT